MKKLVVLFAILLLSGCATIQKVGYNQKPEVTENKLQKEFDAIQPPATKKITVAVYSFKDLTGQRKATPNIASFSTAVTQGAETFLIKALQDVGHGEWFDVVERVNVDNLIKERTIITQMRNQYEGPKAQPLAPLQFAGIIIEGGITGYDSSTKSGGYAARMLGIGPQTQYSEDIVTVTLRLISVNTGKVLASVNVQKTIYSTSDSLAVLKFVKDGTQAFELEAGLTINEPGTQAVKAAVEAAVVELIKEGERKSVWDYRKPESAQAPVAPAVAVAPPAPPADPVVPETKKIETLAVPTSKDPVKMYFIKDTRVYKKKSKLEGPVYGPFSVVHSGVKCLVTDTEFEGVVEVQTESGIKGFVRREKLKADK